MAEFDEDFTGRGVYGDQREEVRAWVRFKVDAESRRVEVASYTDGEDGCVGDKGVGGLFGAVEGVLDGRGECGPCGAGLGREVVGDGSANSHGERYDRLAYKYMKE